MSSVEKENYRRSSRLQTKRSQKRKNKEFQTSEPNKKKKKRHDSDSDHQARLLQSLRQLRQEERQIEKEYEEEERRDDVFQEDIDKTLRELQEYQFAAEEEARALKNIAPGASAEAAASAEPKKRDREDSYQSQTHTDGPTTMTTLHISNLPSDVTERELRNLVALLDGFEGSTVRVKARPLAFVKFSTREHAQNAKSKLVNFAFDPYYPDVYLRVDFARREMNVEKAKRPRIDEYHRRAPSADDYHHYDPNVPAPRVGYSRAPPRAPPAYPPSPRHYSPAPARAAQSRAGGPCDTLCVMGLTDGGPQIRELENNFASQPGFVAQKVPANGRAFGFVKFDSVERATEALQVLRQQGLTSWKTGLPLVIEYAKRSYNHHP